MEAACQEYLNFLETLIPVFEQLTQIAREKTDAVRRDDLVRLNDCMKKEQALSLSLKSVDKKRETMLGNMGLGGVSLANLPQHCPPALHSRAKGIVERLCNQYSVYASAAEVARTTLECNLHQIEKILEGEPAAGGSLTDIRV